MPDDGLQVGAGVELQDGAQLSGDLVARHAFVEDHPVDDGLDLAPRGVEGGVAVGLPGSQPELERGRGEVCQVLKVR